VQPSRGSGFEPPMSDPKTKVKRNKVMPNALIGDKSSF
jgi:hypothetical protein